MLAASFRDCKAWEAEGLPLSTTSNEACKLYDAILNQYVTWRNDETLGGIEGCIAAVQAADPNFVMGHVIGTGLELVGTGSSVLRNEKLAGAVKRTLDLAKSQDLTPREKLHVKAVDLFSRGALDKACDVWEDILVEHPTDMLALKFSHDGFFYLGEQVQMRDSVARVLPHWKPHMPLYSYLKGLYSFGLLETRFYDQAEKVAKEVKFFLCVILRYMLYVCDMLACHNYWHWALYHVEKGEYEAALKIYDDQVSNSISHSTCFCAMVGVNVKGRYRELLQVTEPHSEDHTLLFNDLHFLMVSLGCKNTSTTQRLLESLRVLAKEPGENHEHQLAETIGLPMCEALVEYDQGNYSKAVEILKPIRYHFVEIGGSDAQRDVFSQLLIHSAIKSEDKHHQRYARCLLAERDSVRPNSPLTDRLIQRAHSLHL
uniref:Tetratricopeptide repeat domain 38 n=1 Tax=Astyanax mexicanus TaxID=7994 RepID=A0A8B9KDU1_ASTMX